MWKLEIEMGIGFPEIIFTITLVATSLDSQNSMLSVHAFRDQVSGMWSSWMLTKKRDTRMTAPFAAALVWRLVTEYLMDTKCDKRVSCSSVLCRPNQHTIIEFIPVEDSGSDI